MSRIFFALILILSLKAFAKDPSTESCGAYAQTVQNRLSFSQVEMISRNHSVGLHREASLHLNPWIEVGPKAYLGLDQVGRAVQIIELKDRTVAFLLSGERRLKDLFLRYPNQLVAIDFKGNLLRFQWDLWQDDQAKSLVKSALNFSVAGTCTAAFFSSLMTQLSGAPISSLENLLTIGVAGSAAILIQLYATLIKYGERNDMTDGFAPLGVALADYKTGEAIRNEDGLIVDVELRDRSNRISLTELLSGIQIVPALKGFEYTCEHELLPRGIPSRQYEPQL